MIPFHFTYGKRKGELGSVRDFDLPYAFQDLKHVVQREGRSTWKTALWVNFFKGIIAGAIAFGLWIAWQYDPFAQQTSFAPKVVLGLVGVLFAVVSLLMGFQSLTRGRLVLDHEQRKLLFYRFWFSWRPFGSIRLDNIGRLLWREFLSPGSLDDAGHAYRILVAELKDGRFASIAIDSASSIETEIKRAIGED